jgi:hypothetical protein
MTAAGRAFYRPMAPNQVQAMRKRLVRADLPATEKRLLQLIYRHYRSRTGACHRHLVTLAEELGLTVRHTFRLVRKLSRRGYLEFESTGRRRRNERWQPALYRFRPPARWCQDVRRDGHAEPSKAHSQGRIASDPRVRQGVRETPYYAPAGERLRRARRHGASPGWSARDSGPTPAPDHTAPSGLGSPLRPLPEAHGEQTPRPASRTQLAFDLGEAVPVKGRPPAQSLSETAIRALLEQDPEWLERHPPGSIACVRAERFLVPAYHPDVAIDDDPAARTAVMKRATELAADLAGVRFDVLARVRRRFPGAETRLIERACVHELARAAVIVEHLEAPPGLPAAPDFAAVRAPLQDHRAEPRLPLFDHQQSSASPEVRTGEMIEGITYLETIGAEIMASPAVRWPEPVWIVRPTGQEIELVRR